MGKASIMKTKEQDAVPRKIRYTQGSMNGVEIKVAEDLAEGYVRTGIAVYVDREPGEEG